MFSSTLFTQSKCTELTLFFSDLNKNLLLVTNYSVCMIHRSGLMDIYSRWGMVLLYQNSYSKESPRWPTVWRDLPKRTLMVVKGAAPLVWKKVRRIQSSRLQQTSRSLQKSNYVKGNQPNDSNGSNYSLSHFICFRSFPKSACAYLLYLNNLDILDNLETIDCLSIIQQQTSPSGKKKKKQLVWSGHVPSLACADSSRTIIGKIPESLFPGNSL